MARSQPIELKLGQALSSCSHLDGLGSFGARATGSKDYGLNWWVGKIGTFRPPGVHFDPQTDKALEATKLIFSTDLSVG